MRSSIRTALAGVFTAVIAVMGGVAPAAADPDANARSLTVSPSSEDTVGTFTDGRRIANADGDTAGECLTIEHNGAGPGVVMSACNDVLHQDWFYRFYTVRDENTGEEWDVAAIFSLHPSHLNKCITAVSGGNQLYLAQCSQAAPNLEHVWLYGNPIGGAWAQFESFYYIYWFNLKYCMGVKDEGLSYIVQSENCKSTPPSSLGNQLWKVF